MRLLISSFIMILMLVTPVAANEADAVRKMASERINTVINHLRDQAIDKETRNSLVIKAIKPLFDFSQMAKLSMGKTNWLRMNKAQRAEFNDLFVKRLEESYLEKLDLYNDEEVIVEEAESVKTRIHVLTRLVSDSNKIEMLYKFYKSRGGQWLVYDVEIMGVSIVQTYRSQFAGILENQSVEDLLKKLRQAGSMKIETDNG
ncbi:MAG: hypothetical protein C0623_11510 [Desulfuromonas sp.]|nr:MAG: hypothetical protein C0623_11510 [Desulfuromonas sp.]